MNFQLKNFALLLAFNFFYVNGKDINCGPGCLEEDQSAHCNDWDKDKNGEDKRTPKTLYQYDLKTQKCFQLSCKDDDGLYESETECLELCGECGRVLKQYKLDDECLKPTEVSKNPNPQVEKSKNAEQLSYHSFHIRKGKCLQTIHAEKNLYVTKGLALPTYEECKKRCPSIKD